MTRTIAETRRILSLFQGSKPPSRWRKCWWILTFDFKSLFSNTLKTKLRMPCRCFSDSVLTICRRSSVYTMQLQASDMGYELLCFLDLFVLLDRITICSWVSYTCVNLHLVQICEPNCYLEQTEPFCKDFLLIQYKLSRLILPSLAHLFTFIIKLNCKWLHVCNCMFCCKCFNTSALLCLREVVTEVGRKIVLLEPNLLK